MQEVGEVKANTQLDITSRKFHILKPIMALKYLIFTVQYSTIITMSETKHKMHKLRYEIN